MTTCQKIGCDVPILTAGKRQQPKPDQLFFCSQTHRARYYLDRKRILEIEGKLERGTAGLLNYQIRILTEMGYKVVIQSPFTPDSLAKLKNHKLNNPQ